MKKVFSGIKGLTIEGSFYNEINRTSYGHPYLMQLIGYHLILQINDHDPGREHDVTGEEVNESITHALFAYEQRALKPLWEELPNNEKLFLKKMSECLGEDRLASTSEIAGKAGVSQNKLSRTRAYLIDHGIIAAPEHGKVMFCIPYLADYVKKDAQLSGVVEIARQRRV